MRKKEEHTPMTYGDLIKKAKTKEDLGLGEIEKSPNDSILSLNKRQFESQNQELASLEHLRFIG